MKDNNLYVLNKKVLFDFYYNFYKLLIDKNKSIQIFLNNKEISSQNTILLSLIDYNEILSNIIMKKGNILYEYIKTFLPDLNQVEKFDEEFEKLVNEFVKNSGLDFDYDMDYNIEKILINETNLRLNFNLNNLENIINKILNKLLEINVDKTFIIFYDSDLLNLNFNSYNNYYSFNISAKTINECNLICDDKVKFLDIRMLYNQINIIWPSGIFEKEDYVYLNNYYALKKFNKPLIVNNVNELIIYSILNKFSINKIPIICKCSIDDNIKSFLTNL